MFVAFHISVIFTWAYITLLILTVLTSIAIPIDRAMSYFRIITIIFSFLTLASLTGIVLFLTNQGFYPPVKQYD